MSILSWLDNRTLITCDSLLVIVFAGVFFSTQRVYPSLRGMNSVALSFLMGAAGTLLIAARGSVPYFASVMIGSACVLGSYVLLCRGILRFLGSREGIVVPCVIASAAMAVIYYFSQIQDNVVPRIVVFTIGIGAIRGLIARPLFRKAPTFPNPATMRLFAACTAFFAFVDICCGIVTIFRGAPTNSILLNPTGSVTLILGVVSNCTTGLFMLILCASELIAHSKDESHKDALSGIFNRRGIETQLAAELKHVYRGNHKLSIALIDIDHFKAINDIQGHAAGDNALCDMVTAVSSRLRGRDSLGRYGGDEFLLILPQTAATMALLVAQRMREAVDELSVTGRRQRLTLSIGLTEAVADDDAMTLIARADKALYKAKSDGRNCLRLIRATDPSELAAAPKKAPRAKRLTPAIESTLVQS